MAAQILPHDEPRNTVAVLLIAVEHRDTKNFKPLGIAVLRSIFDHAHRDYLYLPSVYGPMMSELLILAGRVKEDSRVG